jgi:hypothetical protein
MVDVQRGVGVTGSNRVLGVAAAVDVQPQRRRGLAGPGVGVVPILVDDLDAQVLGDRSLVDEVVDQDEVRGRPVVVTVWRGKVHLAALVAGREESLTQVCLEPARADRVGLRRVQQHEVVHHRVVVEVRHRAVGVVGVALVDEAGNHVGDPAVLARRCGVELDQVVHLAVGSHGEGPIAGALDHVAGTGRHRTARVGERRQRGHRVRRGSRGHAEQAHGKHQDAQQNSRNPQSLPHTKAPLEPHNAFSSAILAQMSGALSGCTRLHGMGLRSITLAAYAAA